MGLGIRVWGGSIRCRVWYLRFGFRGVEFGVWGVEIRVWL